VAGMITRELTKIGRNGTDAREVPPDQVSFPERERLALHFTVSSLRLDAVLAGTFNLSRTNAAERIEGGTVQLNHTICEKPAAELRPGDVFSLRSHGKARLAEVSGKSRKDRLRLVVEKYQ